MGVAYFIGESRLRIAHWAAGTYYILSLEIYKSADIPVSG